MSYFCTDVSEIMKKLIVLFTYVILTCQAFGQVPHFEPIDTIETEMGTMLIYPNRVWALMGEEKFDGVLNDSIDHIMCADTTYEFESGWDHNRTILSTGNAVEEMQDTVWICVLDSLHGGFCIPRVDRVTSRYGRRRGRNHNGIDIDLETGDTIYAAFDGVVRYSQYHENGFGNLVIIRHFNGLETYYGHCSELMVAPNQPVKAGDPIAKGGNTGRSTGSHLHFEVRFYDNPINPEIIFDFDSLLVKDENLLVSRHIFRGGSSSSVAHHKTATYDVDKSSATHKIRSGDTLGKIAGMYGTSVSEICRLNNMKETDILHIGVLLRVK